MKMDDIQRELLLSRLEREFPSGFRIPERVEGIEIRKRVFEAMKEGEDAKEELAKELRDLELRMMERLKREEMSFEEGERIVENIMGIRKAIMILEGDEESMSEKIKRARKEDFLRWKKFIEQIKGSDKWRRFERMI